MSWLISYQYRPRYIDPKRGVQSGEYADNISIIRPSSSPTNASIAINLLVRGIIDWPTKLLASIQ